MHEAICKSQLGTQQGPGGFRGGALIMEVLDLRRLVASIWSWEASSTVLYEGRDKRPHALEKAYSLLPPSYNAATARLGTSRRASITIASVPSFPRSRRFATGLFEYGRASCASCYPPMTLMAKVKKTRPQVSHPRPPYVLPSAIFSRMSITPHQQQLRHPS